MDQETKKWRVSESGKLRKYPPEVYEQVYGLYKDGISATKIAEIVGLGFTRNAILGMVHRAIRSKELEPRVGFVPKVKKFHVPKKLKISTAPTAELPAPLPNNVVPLKPEPVHEEPGVQNLGLFDLRDHHCRWTEDTKSFCGRSRISNSWWCDQHHHVVYRKGTAWYSRRKAKSD